MEWIVLVGGLYLILMSFLLDTKNLRSAIIFKFTPFLLGSGNILVALNMMGVLSLNL